MTIMNPSGLQATHTWEFKAGNNTARLCLEQKGRKFTVTHSEIVGDDKLSLGFSPKGAGVINVDETSDAVQCFNVSMSVKVDDIVLNFDEMTAGSPEELQAAFKKVKILTYISENI
jgi:hypothetical protein